MKTIVKSKEKPRVDKIMNFIKSLDPKSQEAFENVMIGFTMAQNLKLAPGNENDKHM